METVPEAELIKSLPKGNEKILFVDDELALLQMSQKMLEKLGYEVVSCSNGLDALEVFRLEPDTFHLVITDQTMPIMTGTELVQELLKIRPDIPIILCTGFSELIDSEKARELGAKEYIMKPIVMREIAGTIRKVLDTEGL